MDEFSALNFDEMTIEVKPDQRSLSHASTTLERRGREAAESEPLIFSHRHPPPPPLSGNRRVPLRESDRNIVRVQPMLDITAPEDDEEESEEDKEDLGRSNSEEDSEGESEEEEEEGDEEDGEEGSEEESEEGSEEESSEETDEEESDHGGFQIPED